MLILFKPFGMLEEWIISLFLLIDSVVYGFFSKLYSLFLDLATARIFKMEVFENVIYNLYIIFGVVALFIIAFSILQNMFNPDSVEKGTKNTFDVIKRLVLAVGLTCTISFFFDFLYDFQFSILTNNVIQKATIGGIGAGNIGDKITYTDTDGTQKEIEVDITEEEIGKAGLQLYGNSMAYYVLSGFIYDNDIDGDGDVVVNASKYFDVGTGTIMGVIGCIGGVAVTGVLAMTGVGIPAAATTAAGTAAICTGGVVAGIIVNDVLETVTAEEFSWNFTVNHLFLQLGEFKYLSAFSSAVSNGEMTYTFILSTIAGCILLYMLFSFCLDLGVRAAKLAFYQMVAPISFLLSIVPKNKDLMSNWFKLVITTWVEVFIRVLCLCGVALLVSNLNFVDLDSLGFVARAIIILGLITFAKQFPKLLGEVTGIKSANLKLGIKDKLAEGGAFTAGAIIGGGATALTRNLTNKWGNKKNWQNENGEVTAGSVLKNLGAGLTSGIAGGLSASARSGKAGINAKSSKDMRTAAGTGAKGAVDAREKRAAYKARHGGGVIDYGAFRSGDFKGAITGGVIGSHISDIGYGIGGWAGLNNIDSLVASNKLISEIQSQRKAIDNEARDLIIGDLAKHKGKSDYDNVFGSTYNMAELEQLEAILQEAKASGSAADIQKAQHDFDGYVKKWQDTLIDQTLIGAADWKRLATGTVAEQKMVAELSKVRMASDKYRETVSRNASESFISGLTDYTDIIDKEKAITHSHATMDTIKDAMKIAQTENARKINEIKQREEETKK